MMTRGLSFLFHRPPGCRKLPITGLHPPGPRARELRSSIHRADGQEPLKKFLSSRWTNGRNVTVLCGSDGGSPAIDCAEKLVLDVTRPGRGGWPQRQS